MLKAFKYRLYPNEEQCVLMEKHFGCTRLVYNWGLAQKIKAYTVDKKKLSCFDLINEIVKLKKEFPWLSEVYSQCLQMSLRNLDNAFTAFFRKNSKFPNFKSKHKSRCSCQYPQGVKVDFKKQEVYFPKMKEVKAILHREFKGDIKTCTLSKTSTGKYFVSILVEDSKELPKKKKVTEKKTLGIDVGIKHFATFSDGNKVENPKFLRKSEKRLGSLQRSMDRKVKGSKNRQEAKLLVAKQYEKITNQRKDFLHKLTHNLVCENQATMFVCEDLNVKGMVKNHKLAKSIADVGWGIFDNFLQYKCDWYGKTFQQIGMFEPSSKMCSVCGYLNQSLTLNIREWLCPKCNTLHDRDKNASINIKNFGYIRFQGTGIESKQSPSERLGSNPEQ
jgi:putative transposase